MVSFKLVKTIPFNFIRAKSLKLNEIRRILEIMSTNRVENEEEVAKLSQLLFQANISSNDEGYEKLMNHVRISLIAFNL
jgi:hypothetical protein